MIEKMCIRDSINYVKYNKQCIERPAFSGAGVDYFVANDGNPEDVEARMWIDAVKNDGEVVVKPEQALVVTRILRCV